MDIVAEYRKKLEDLEKSKRALLSLPNGTPELHYLIMVTDQQIRDAQMRLERFTMGKLSYQCSYCSSWIKTEGIPTTVGSLVICEACKSTIKGVINTQQAEDEWGLPKGTIRQDCHPRRGVLKPYIDAGLVFLSGRYWHIHRSTMYAHYGDPKPKEETGNSKK